MKNPIDWDCANGIVNDGLYSGFSKYLIETSHRQLSKFGNASVTSVERILEIGAGRGEYYRFVTNDFSEYLMTDISDWGRSEIEVLAETDCRIKFEVQDMQNLTFEDESFDRVIVSCVLAHVDEPYVALSEVKRITKKRRHL
jgi:ubiquinone/menaquinone biosynthesis C-methylase UbiE